MIVEAGTTQPGPAVRSGLSLPLFDELSDPLAVDIAIAGVPVCARGAAVPHDLAALEEAVTEPEVEYTVALPGEGADAEVFFSDLSHEYVTINAEYTT